MKTYKENLIELLGEKEKWVGKAQLQYHTLHPEHTASIQYDEDLSLRKPSYTFLMANESTSFGKIKFYYNGVNLESLQYISLDGGRYATVTPEKEIFSFDEFKRNLHSYRYFIKHTLEHAAHDFLYEESNEDERIAHNKLMGAVLVFDDQFQKLQFDQYLIDNKDTFESQLNIYTAKNKINDKMENVEWIELCEWLVAKELFSDFKVI